MTLSETDLKNSKPSFLQQSFQTSKQSAKEYVQDSLVAMWDGIENAGYGVHDSSTTVWRDLSNSKFDVETNKLTQFEEWAEDAILLRYGGTNVFTTKSFPQNNLNSTWTVEVVIEVADGAVGSLGGICGLCGDGKNGISFQCRQSTGIKLGVESASNTSVELGTAAFRQGTKQTLTLCCNSRNGVCYVNAVMSGSKSGMSPLEHSGFIIGGDYSNKGSVLDTKSTSSNRRFAGKICCIRMYGKSLSAAEVAANYAVDRMRFGLTDKETR